jgi:AraC-like DNA-binding protein
MLKDLVKNLHLQINVARYEELDSNWNTSKFLHDSRIVSFARLYLPVEGEGYFTYFDKKYHIRPGHIYLIPPYAPTEVNCPQRLLKYWTNFNAYIFNSSLDLFSIFQFPGELPVNEHDREYFIRLFQVLTRRHRKEGPSRNNFDEFSECGALALLLTPFLNAIKSESAKTEFEKSKRISDLLAYIEKHLDQQLTLKKLGKEFGLSPTYLTNFFASIMGEPIMSYCHNRRIKRAIDLLCSTDLSISEIADRIGASDVSNFSKRFKKQIGVSPLIFRKNHHL